MLECPDVVAYLKQAASDDLMRYEAESNLGAAISLGLLERQQRSGLRISDVGSCVREVWYKEHGQIDLPVDPIDLQLTRFDEGSLNGAWAACLIAEAARADGWQVKLEQALSFANIPGHADVYMWRDGGDLGLRSHIVEIKTKYETAAIKEPESYQVLQAAAYANDDNEFLRSQTFSVLVLSPSAKKGERAKQFDYEAEPFHALVAADFYRLRAALGDEPPEGDPKEPWRCYTCGASACSLNKNKQQDSVEVLF